MTNTGDERSLFRGGEREDAERFAKRMQELEETGCSILVTGNAERSTFVDQMAQAFGTPSEKQVLVSPHSLETPTRFLPDSVAVTDESVRLFESGFARRATVITESSRAGDLRSLGDDVLAAIDELSDEFDVGDNDLRVGVTALEEFDSSAQDLTQFVRELGHFVGLVNGTVYCHVYDDPSLAERLSDLFDVRVELRSEDDHAEQRWKLPDEDVTTRWTRL